MWLWHSWRRLLKKINIESENYHEVACKYLQFNITNKDEIKHQLMNDVAIFKHVHDNLYNYHH